MLGWHRPEQMQLRTVYVSGTAFLEDTVISVQDFSWTHRQAHSNNCFRVLEELLTYFSRAAITAQVVNLMPLTRVQVLAEWLGVG
jgi:hypothetical protein